MMYMYVLYCTTHLRFEPVRWFGAENLIACGDELDFAGLNAREQLLLALDALSDLVAKRLEQRDNLPADVLLVRLVSPI